MRFACLDWSGEGLDHPEVAQHVGGELHFDTFGGFKSPARGGAGVVDQDMERPPPALGQGLDGGPPGDVDQFVADIVVAGGANDVLNGAPGAPFIPAGQDDFEIPFFGDALGDGLADGSVAACDDGDELV
ncbi:MAG: hypothetical protein P8Y14_12500 [Anaerolineales bacterium]